MKNTMITRGSGEVQRAVAALAAGRMVVVVDDHDREDEGDLVLAADTATAQQIAFVVANTTGIVCAPMPAEHADRLRLPPMTGDNTDPHGTAFTVTVDHVDCGTGVSAADRAHSLRALADPATTPADLRRPGHVFPLRAREGGVLVRAGHTEAAVDLLRLAGRAPIGVISEIVDVDGSMRRGESLRAFAAEHDLPVLSIAELVRYRRAEERLVEPVAWAEMPTEFGAFRAVAYRSVLDGTEHATCAGTRAAGSASATRSGPTPRRRRGATHSTPTRPRGSRSTRAATATVRRSSATSGSSGSG